MPEAALHTVHQLIANADPTRPAIAAPGRPALTYGELETLASSTIDELNQAGVGRGDRIAVLLPNGPEMAAAFLTFASGCSAAPLNPAYRAEELRFYLADLRPEALVLMQDADTPARDVALQLGIPVWELRPDPDGAAGRFSLRIDGTGPARGGYSVAGDEALVLHTSGTTSRPKVVPLLNRNLAASAAHVSGTLSLDPTDVGLGIMPLFHIHGLIASVLASVAAGAQVCCTPGFNALRFFQWLEEIEPTWYTAVPTMHQAILGRARRHAALLSRVKLRFVRSSSSSLPASVMQEMEAVFDCPVIESYGMTEATHQMASNLLPPGQRKPGTVGVAAGPEIAVMGSGGGLLDPGAEGEVVIRGPNVFEGYQNNPEANADAFEGGWFRTGDQGHMDADGYLTISGRLKEIINRGGEKIAPREVDDVLQAHPAVAQVVTFAVPHPKLGEDVAAVVVTVEGAEVTERELRTFASERLADFKVPRRVVFRDEIPKGATGKLQRIGLAAKLGLEA